MTKIGFILSIVTVVYCTNFIIFNTILSFSISWFYSKIIVEKSFNLFSSLIVIEIAYIAIFYSSGKGTQKAKQQEWKSKKGKINFYHYLLIKNYFSLLVRFLLLILLFISENLLSDIDNLSISKYIEYFIKFSSFLAIFSFIITFDLMISMFYFLWGNIEK